MKSLLPVVFLSLFLFACTPLSAHTISDLQDALPLLSPTMIERVRPTVVKIKSSIGADRGTGVIFKVENSYAYIVTNQHVVGHDKTFQLAVWNTAYEYPYNPQGATGEIVAVDYERDLAVIRMPCPPPMQCASAAFGDSLSLNVGDPVIAIGYPYANVQPLANVRPIKITGELDPPSVTQGIVSAFRYHSTRKRQLVQHDAPINPGSSGGPLFNSGGQVVGINTFEIRGSEGLNYAIAETTIQNQIPELLAGRSSGTPSIETVLVPVFGPMVGHLHHEPGDGEIEFSRAIAVPHTDVFVEAFFGNPYHGGPGILLKNFSYGFILRGNNEGSLRFYVSSDGYWVISKYSTSDNSFTTMATGPAPTLRRAKGQYNKLLVGMVGNRAVAYLNYEPLATADGSKSFALGGHTQSGGAWIATGLEHFNEYEGAVTDFSGWRIAYPVSVELSDDGTIPPAVEEWMYYQERDEEPSSDLGQHSHGPPTEQQATP